MSFRTFVCFLSLSLLSCLIFSQFDQKQRVFGGTYYQSWYLGENEENQTPADAYVVYTYPDRVQAGKPFQVGVILQYINDKNSRSSWIVFSDVSIKLASAQLSTFGQAIGQAPVLRSCDNKMVSDSDTSGIIVKGKLYSHHFSLFAPKCAGEYLVFLNFHAIFSPESIGETGFDWCAGCRYLNASDSNDGEILSNELPTFNVTDTHNQARGMGRLIVGIEEPYGHIRPIPVNVTNTNKTKDFNVVNAPITDRKEFNVRYGSYNVVVPRVVPINDDEVHAVFSRWADGNNYYNRTITVTPDNDTDLFALYDTEYHLSVESNSWLPTQPSGTDWYPAGSDAKFGIDPSLMFFLLHSFDHWKADNYTIFTSDYAATAGSLTMDGPKQITAVWKWDYGDLAIIIGIVAVAVPILRKFWRRLHEVERKASVR